MPNTGIQSYKSLVPLCAACRPHFHRKLDQYENKHFCNHPRPVMARTKQTAKVKPFGSPQRKFINKAIVKTKTKASEKQKARRAASSYINQKISLFKKEDMEAAVNLYRGSRLPGYHGKPLFLRALEEQFKHKHITFGSLQKRISGKITYMGPSRGRKGHPRILPRDVEGM